MIIKEPCPSCGGGPVVELPTWQAFPYGRPGPGQVQLEALVPLKTCGACMESFTDYRAEKIRDHVVERYKAKLAREKKEREEEE